MWFLSKHTTQKHHHKSEGHFLRRGLLQRRKRRTLVEQKKIHYWPAGVFLLWLLFVATLFYVAFFSVFFLIGEVRIIGASTVSEETIQRFVEQQLDEKYFNLFPRLNFFLARPYALEKILLDEYPLLSSANVTRVFPDGMHITVTERKKIILWCSQEQCFLVDESGIARDASRALLPENVSHTILITDMSGKPAVIGEKVFDSGYGMFVVELNEMFTEQLGIALAPRLTTVSRFANEVRVKTTEGWEVYFGTDVPLQSSLNALKLLFEKELPKELRTKLAYIDLRTENRVYYAFRTEENTENKDVVASPALEEKKDDEQKNKKKK
jgi:cell division septal protein FtsQ